MRRPPRSARRPYDLRHAAVSLWLDAGVPPTQAAEWAKCLVGQEEAAQRRIAQALGAGRDGCDLGTS
jgi:hypothetical protein